MFFTGTHTHNHSRFNNLFWDIWDSSQVSFFSDFEESNSIFRPDHMFVPRENPRALLIRPLEAPKSPLPALPPPAGRQDTLAPGTNGRDDAPPGQGGGVYKMQRGVYEFIWYIASLKINNLIEKKGRR